jgi:hypothetical protein
VVRRVTEVADTDHDTLVVSDSLGRVEMSCTYARRWRIDVTIRDKGAAEGTRGSKKSSAVGRAPMVASRYALVAGTLQHADIVGGPRASSSLSVSSMEGMATWVSLVSLLRCSGRG